MEIKTKIVKEVVEVVGYQCDICKNTIDIKHMFLSKSDLNIVKYTVPTGGYGERSETIIEHVCSAKCLKQSLNSAAYGADVFLSRKLIEELIKE